MESKGKILHELFTETAMNFLQTRQLLTVISLK